MKINHTEKNTKHTEILDGEMWVRKVTLELILGFSQVYCCIMRMIRYRSYMCRILLMKVGQGVVKRLEQFDCHFVVPRSLNIQPPISLAV